MTLALNTPAPAFTVLADDGKSVSLADFKGQAVVLYFYPKDDTPGCTTESCAFRDLLPRFEGVRAVILGVSRDSVASHQKFKAKYALPFPLLADEDGALCESYGVWVEKSMYGKKYMGIERSTFLIDKDGVLNRIWSKVKVDGHAEEVLATVNGL
jgi:thioredoxin-dependent peroxiredoxin